MKRQIALAAGAAVVVAGSLAFGPGVVRAFGSHDEDQTIEKRVVVRTGGGRLGVSIDDPTGDARGALVRSRRRGQRRRQGGAQGRRRDRPLRRRERAQREPARAAGGGDAGRPRRRDRGDARRSDPEAHRDARRARPRLPLRRRRRARLELRDAGAAGRPRAARGNAVAPRAAPPRRRPTRAPMAWSWNGDDGFMVHGLAGGPRKLGIEYMEMGEQLAGYFKLSGKTGVLVTSVDADGPAAKAGMKAGDVVTKLGTDAIADSDDLREAVSRAEGGCAGHAHRAARRASRRAQGHARQAGAAPQASARRAASACSGRAYPTRSLPGPAASWPRGPGRLGRLRPRGRARAACRR